MEGYYRLLPAQERQSLEPSQIVRALALRHGIPIGRKTEASETRHILVTLTSHFCYGAVGGIGYTSTVRWLPIPALTRGALYGLAPFSVAYLGWLPSFGILAPASSYPRARIAGLLAAHFVYGCVTAAVANQLS